jgi:hypothetical protein
MPTKFSRKDIKAARHELDRAVAHGDFEAFKTILTEIVGLAPGSDRFRDLESKFWQAVAERKKNKSQGL